MRRPSIHKGGCGTSSKVQHRAPGAGQRSTRTVPTAFDAVAIFVHHPADPCRELRHQTSWPQAGEGPVERGRTAMEELGLACEPFLIESHLRSEEHTSELQSRFGFSYAVFFG